MAANPRDPRKIKLEVSKDTIRGKITGGIKPDIARYREKKKGNRIQKKKKKKGGKSNIEQEGNCYGIWEYEKVVGSKNVNEKAIGRLSSRSFDLRPQSRSARFFRWRRFFFFFSRGGFRHFIRPVTEPVSRQ